MAATSAQAVPVKTTKRRIKVRQQYPVNILFAQWLAEWKEKAEERELQSRFGYGMALASLKKYSLELKSGKDASMLAHFGPKTCNDLDKKLEQYRREYGEPVLEDLLPPELIKSQRDQNGSNSANGGAASSSSSVRKKRMYIPQPRSGAWAIVMALYRYQSDPDPKPKLSKDELMELAQPLADKSFAKPDPGSYYTAWSSMSTLVEKGLVIKQNGSKCKYSLSMDGIELAQTLDSVDPTAIALPAVLPSAVSSPRKRLDFSDASSSKRSKKTKSDSASADRAATSKKTKSNADTASAMNVRSDVPATAFVSKIKRTGGTKVVSPAKAFSVGFASAEAEVQPDFDFAWRDSPPSPVPLSLNFTHDAAPSNGDDGMIDLVSDDENHDEDCKNFSRSLTKATMPAIQKSNFTSTCLSGAEVFESSPDLRYVFITTDGKETKRMQDASVQINEESGHLMYKVKANLTQLDHSGVQYCLCDFVPQSDATDTSLVIAYLDEADALPVAPGLASQPIKPLLSEVAYSGPTFATTSSLPISSTVASSSVLPDRRANVDVDVLTGEPSTSSIVASSLRLGASSTSSHRLPVSPTQLSKQSSTASSVSTQESQESTTSSIVEIHAKASNGVDTAFLRANDGDAELTATPSFSLEPGTFDVVLCMDNTEVTGIGASHGGNKAKLINGLMDKRVVFDQRKLHVGDFLWVARERAPSKRELVFDFIIERKRMDDLASSIVDHRFDEQKLRLKTCGLRRVIYLFEEYKDDEHFCKGLPRSSLEQAIVNTEVIDDLMIKQTKDTDATVSYLSAMTRFIETTFSYRKLNSCSKRKALESKELMLDLPEYDLMVFAEFNAASMKNRPMTISEIFVNQLMQFPGISVLKALAIVRIYPTMRCLIDAYAQCQSEKEKETLVAKIKYGAEPVTRNIGPAVSKMLYRFFCCDDDGET